ncbi:MAG: hypothetical protein ACTSRK_09300 [Promethearchaeota archaeon]
MALNIEELATLASSSQLKTLVIPCSRCKSCRRIEFLSSDTVYIDCEHFKLEDKITEIVKKTRVCLYYCESIDHLKKMLNPSNSC